MVSAHVERVPIVSVGSMAIELFLQREPTPVTPIKAPPKGYKEQGSL